MPAAHLSGGAGARFAPQNIVWPLGAIALVIALQASMAFTRAVNWDEFWFYYHVAEFTRGNLSSPLQSLHVRLFAWLPLLPGNAVDHIALARLLMLGCEMLTIGAIYSLACRFTRAPVAALAALCYASAGFVFQHGFSFRTDPMITALLMWALVILARWRLGALAMALFGLLAALAVMISIKTVLLAPAFAGLAWMRLAQSERAPATAMRLAGCVLAAMGALALLFAWHSHGLAAPQAAGGNASGTLENAGGTLGASLRWMFFIGVPPYWIMAVKNALVSLVLTGLAFWTPAILWRSDRPVAERIALAGLWFPALCPFFYTNSAPYFYAFSLAPVAVSIVWAAERLNARYDLRKLSLVMAALTLALFATENRTTAARQAQVVDAAARFFPEGIAYFDLDGMIARFHKANDLLTPWGMAQYAEARRPLYREAMERRAVPVVLANADVLEMALAGQPVPLRDDDVAALRGNYIAYWGPFHIAGKHIDAAVPRDEEFLVPGTYRVLEGDMVLDGATHAQGALVEITRGMHRISGTATLRWGAETPEPDMVWDGGPLYVDF